MSRINIKRLLEQIVFEFDPVMREKKLTCIIDASPDLMIRCDGEKIQRVFDNLLRNAVNYSFPDTEILLSVKENSRQRHMRGLSESWKDNSSGKAGADL